MCSLIAFGPYRSWDNYYIVEALSLNSVNRLKTTLISDIVLIVKEWNFVSVFLVKIIQRIPKFNPNSVHGIQKPFQITLRIFRELILIVMICDLSISPHLKMYRNVDYKYMCPVSPNTWSIPVLPGQ